MLVPMAHYRLGLSPLWSFNFVLNSCRNCEQSKVTQPPGTEPEEEEEQEVDRLSSQDAYLFPVVRHASALSLSDIVQ